MAINNPFGRVTGTWEAHSSYSLGGTDHPTPYGTLVLSPAPGRLVYDGWVGTAGRRATFYLDTPIERVAPPSTRRMLGGYVEAEGPLVAFVYQHLSDAAPGRYDRAGIGMLRSGASADGREFGGDIHMHWHGLDARGNRVDVMKFIGGSSAGGGAIIIGREDEMNEEQNKVLYQTRDAAASAQAGIWFGGSATIDGIAQKFNYGVLPVVTHSQKLASQTIGMLNGLTQAVEALSKSQGQAIDLSALERAARQGAESATVLDEDDLRRIAAFVATDLVRELPAGTTITADHIVDELAKRLAK